jgi:trimethylamine--corrinoid protein Co-methyltransferase
MEDGGIRGLEARVLEQRRSRHAYRPLSEDDIRRIHDATMSVLSDVGFEVHEPEAFELFRRAGARVDSERRVVRIKERTVRQLVASAPCPITLFGRAPGTDVVLGAGKVHCGTGGTALNVLDYETGERREATLQDLVDVSRLVDRLENIHLLLLPTYPNELAIEAVDVNRFFAGLMYTTKHVMGGVFTAEGFRDVITMAERIAGSPAALRERPFISMITCGISPLRLDAKYGSFMMEIAREGLPVAVPTEPLAGATSPVTLAGSLVIQNCDALINVMATQLVNPGTPVIYGCVASTADLRDMKYLGAPVESALLNAASAQLARHYRLPYYSTAGISDSKSLDAQCGYESAASNLLVALAGGDFIHDAAGLMEFALTVSKEKLVIDNDIVGMALRAVRGITVNDQTLAVQTIKEVGPGGNFVAARHTRKHMHKEHYLPPLSDRKERDEWERAGARTTAERAHEQVTQMLAEPTRAYLPDGLVEALFAEFPTIERKPYTERNGT